MTRGAIAPTSTPVPTAVTALTIGMTGMVACPVMIRATSDPSGTLPAPSDPRLVQAVERCRWAISSSGYPRPTHVRVDVVEAGRAPVESSFDLAITASLLAAQGVIDPVLLDGVVLLGALCLDGSVTDVRGVLPALIRAKTMGIGRAVVSVDNLDEARLVDAVVPASGELDGSGLDVRGVRNIADMVGVLHGGAGSSPAAQLHRPDYTCPDLAGVDDQPEARWALEVAAAGGHNLFLHGTNIADATLLASCLPSILPDLDPAESIDVAMVASLAGFETDALPVRRPYVAPHSGSSLASLIGGGPRLARPGAFSLADHGVLYLENAPEFPVHDIEALRGPLDTGEVVLGRADATVRFPARFHLVLSAAPCPCDKEPGDCVCTPMAIRRYAARVTGPVLDRIEINAPVRPYSAAEKDLQAMSRRKGFTVNEDSATMRELVLNARARQAERFAGTRWTTNAEMSGTFLRRELPLPDGIDLLDRAITGGRFSARGADQVLRLAWTVADLRGLDRPDRDCLTDAMDLRDGTGAAR